jgi:hypothetical protein
MALKSEASSVAFYVNVAGRVCEPRTVFGLLKIFFDVSMTAPNANKYNLPSS